MRGVFDEREAEPASSRPDKELTLTSTTLLVFFFALVLLCGLCFGLGYSLGHHASQDSADHLLPGAASPGASASDNSRAKPSAIAQPAAATSNIPAQQPAPAVVRSSAASGSVAAPAASNGSSSAAQQPLVKPALAAINPIQPALAASTVEPGSALSKVLMVQIAAVAQTEDADVLTSALRKRGYGVVARREPLDGLIHVRIGPFRTSDEAEKWREKLLSDGYNAIVQP